MNQEFLKPHDGDRSLVPLFSPRISKTFDPNVLPGFEISQWPTLREPSPLVVSTTEWHALPLQERVRLEQDAVRHYLQQKSEEYRNALAKAVSDMPPLPQSVSLQVVMGAYNEQDGIGNTIDQLALRIRDTFGERPEDQKAGVMIVVNRPVTDDVERETRDRNNLLLTVETIEKKKAEYPFVQLEYVILEAPKDIAGIGLARMLGHDITALRTLGTENSKRKEPFFIQTADADMTRMSPTYFSDIFETLKRTDYKHDVYREALCFPVADIIRHPLLDSLDFFWMHSIRVLAEKTDQPWTVGAAILVSLYAHAEGGGVFPFKFQSGVDEDLRIGYHARSIRPHKDNMGQVEPMLLETDPRRFILVAGDLMLSMQKDNLCDPANPLTKDYRLTVTGLKTYLDFHAAVIRTQKAPSQADPGWIFNPTEFNKALPIRALEVVANSYREFIREQLSIHYARSVSSDVATSFKKFEDGHHAYCLTDFAYADVEGRFIEQHKRGEYDPAFEAVLKRASDEATEAVVSILRAHDIACEPLPCSHLPTGGTPESTIPWAVKITDSNAYRERLKQKVMNSSASGASLPVV